MTVDIEGLLGAEGKKLLEHKCTTIPKESIHLPGPDYVERIYSLSDRPTPVLKNLQSLLDHGRLGGTGYVSILPVDQGIEHSAGASFAHTVFLIETKGEDVREALFEVATRNHWPILQMTPESYSLEDVFRQLTSS